MKQRNRITLNRKSVWAPAACVIMAIAALIRLWYYLSGILTPYIVIVHLFLPVTAAVLFIVGTILGGKRFKPFCIGAVALGVSFFAVKAAVEFTPLHRWLCTLLYAGVITVYTLTVLGVLPTPRLLIPLFGLPLLYHIFVEDTQLYVFAVPPVPFRDWLPEISVLCIMGALLCQSFCLQKNADAER